MSEKVGIGQNWSESVGIGQNPWSEMSGVLMGGTLYTLSYILYIYRVIYDI